MSKTKRSSTGSLKGFILLVIIIAGALYLYQNDNKAALPETVKQQVEQTVDNTGKFIGKASEERTENRGSVTASKLEIPVSVQKRDEIRLVRTAFTISYNNFYKTPNWVAWELTRQETEGNEERKTKFLPDPDLPKPRVEHSDYTHSGYDRGHMAPAADMKWSEQAMQESFYMSNICPQNQKLNRDDWGDLEEMCRNWAKKYGRIYIACGPIYDQSTPKRIGQHKVAVPDRFFKVVLIYNRKNPIAMGFLFNNKAGHNKLEKYMVPVDSVETITGLDFFSRLPDDIENRIEAIIPALP